MKVVIFGLGSYEKGSGVSAAKFFIEKGAEVLITDLKTKHDLARQIKNLENFCRMKKRALPKFVLGEHRKADFHNADLVVRNPGVPKNSKFLALAKNKKIPVETDISIFLKNCPAKVIGVTGTRGKSTTATLIYKLLGTRYPIVWLGGNIKISPLSFVGKVKAGDIVVLELSSWMLENFRAEKLAPHIAVVTNIYPDHLNTYKNMAEYIAAKKNIFACQKKDDALIVNGENAKTKNWKGAGKTIKFYKKDAAGLKTNLLGAHNLENIAAALSAVKIMKVPQASVKKVLKNFRGLPDRQELIAVKNGIKYINDTTATTPDGAIAALRAFGQKIKNQKSKIKNIVLIVGGKDKNLEYNQLAKEIKKYCKAVVFFPGTATEKIQLLITNYELLIMTAQNMTEAVRMASALAKKGDIILLSPAAASFGLFQNEFDRGEKFKKAVK